jgi:hypothetical protein
MDLIINDSYGNLKKSAAIIVAVGAVLLINLV